jgi:hypothetical protein
MKRVGRFLVVVALAGCAGAEEPLARPEEVAPVDPAVAELERRIAGVEARLAKGDDEVLRRDRLVLSVALVELRRQLAAGVAADLARVVADAERSVDIERARVASAAAPTPRTRNPRGHALAPIPAASGAVDLPTDAPDEEEKDGSKQDGKIGKARVVDDGSGQPAALLSAVEGKLPAMEACLGDLDDDVTIQVIVRLDTGVVKDPRVSGIAAEPAGCIGDVLRTVRVPNGPSGSKIVRFPLYFAAR